jgi:formyl-CoA transferase
VSALPLEGVKVIDLTQVMLGPCATQLLADFGADVIKIEKPGSGDLSRWSIPDPAGLDNPVFVSLNRNKRSVALNLKHEKARAIVREMVKSADVIVNNFRPDVMERMGLGYETLREINRRIIFAFGTGFGRSGPYAHKGGQDVLAQAMTGVMARKADPEHPLAIYPTALADYSAAMHLVQGILLALLQREKTGEGQMVDVSLYDSMLAMQTQEASMWLMRGEHLNWGAMPLSGVFETKDGALVLVGAFRENPLRDICAALEIEDLSREDRFRTMEGMREHRAELQRTFRERFRSNRTAHWIARLEAQDLLCAPVRSLDEALDDPQTRENGMIVESGDAHMVGAPIHLSGSPMALRHPPPHLGEHSDAVLRELGYDADAIRDLRSQGVVA